LEIGSGPGANLWYMAREGFCVFGIDGSPSACEIAMDRLKEENIEKDVQIKIGNYHQLLNDFEDDFFDAIIDVESLYCNDFKTSQDIVKSCFEKLKPGGKMLSITFAEGTSGLTGTEVGYHAVMPDSGFMKGMGFSRFTTRDDIDELYKLSCNSIEKVEREEQSLQDRGIIKEWIIEIQKKY